MKTNKENHNEREIHAKPERIKGYKTKANAVKGTANKTHQDIHSLFQAIVIILIVILNVRISKNLPGRKTDQAVAYKQSIIPAREMRNLCWGGLLWLACLTINPKQRRVSNP